jgi:hypothetical protein
VILTGLTERGVPDPVPEGKIKSANTASRQRGQQTFFCSSTTGGHTARSKALYLGVNLPVSMISSYLHSPRVRETILNVVMTVRQCEFSRGIRKDVLAGQIILVDLTGVLPEEGVLGSIETEGGRIS